MYSSSFRLTNRDIDLAFEARHLHLVLQPKIELASGRVLGAEAYVRWLHPDYGLMPPGLFLSFFDRHGRSGELTRFVAGAAAETMESWRLKGQNWPISINISGSDLTDPTLPGTLDGIVGEHGLDPASFTIEVPEGVFARHGRDAAETISEIRRLGFRTALDGGGAVIVPPEFVKPDFFSEIKISGGAIIQFARRLQQSGLGFIGKRVALAASLGLDATAVGVEDETTLSSLAAMGFTAAQGAHICSPKEARDLVGWTFAQDIRRDFAETARENELDELLLSDPLNEEDEALTRLKLSPAELILDYDELDFAIPGLADIPVPTGALDPVCIFPDRKLVALLRRPTPHGRRLAGVDRPIRMRVKRPKSKQKKKSFLERVIG
ncbi:EAL domain-containing protein, partial [Parvibaculum sp.]|uniref:EAL domain-containing protein n=1 Tax=Parvibaculum sp. TaxID=2024848 RepID=UPI002B76743B